MRLLTWNINSLPPTLANIQLKYKNLGGYFQAHALDIICLQEAKVPEHKINKDMACVEGYESFWAPSHLKQGYSGVTTWVSKDYSPVSAHKSLTDGLSDIGTDEGRIMVTDHGEFVLINVYVPNAGDRPARPRLEFKLRFLTALRDYMVMLRDEGRQVIAVGDFNVALTAQDVHPSIDFDKEYCQEELSLMRGLASLFPDVWRQLHPDNKDTFTVWDEKTSARAFNAGLRIDYVLVSPSLLSKVVSCEIFDTPPKWSDHAALLLEMRDVATVPPHPPCALSSLKNKKWHDPSQKSIAAMFGGAKAPTQKLNGKKRLLDTGSNGTGMDTARKQDGVGVGESKKEGGQGQQREVGGACKGGVDGGSVSESQQRDMHNEQKGVVEVCEGGIDESSVRESTGTCVQDEQKGVADVCKGGIYGSGGSDVRDSKQGSMQDQQKGVAGVCESEIFIPKVGPATVEELSGRCDSQDRTTVLNLKAQQRDAEQVVETDGKRRSKRMKVEEQETRGEGRSKGNHGSHPDAELVCTQDETACAHKQLSDVEVDVDVDVDVKDVAVSGGVTSLTGVKCERVRESVGGDKEANASAWVSECERPGELEGCRDAAGASKTESAQDSRATTAGVASCCDMRQVQDSGMPQVGEAVHGRDGVREKGSVLGVDCGETSVAVLDGNKGESAGPSADGSEVGGALGAGGSNTAAGVEKVEGVSQLHRTTGQGRGRPSGKRESASARGRQAGRGRTAASSAPQRGSQPGIKAFFGQVAGKKAN